MPALPSPGAIIQTEMLWAVDDDTSALTRLFFEYTGGAPSQSALSSFCTDVDAAVSTYLAQLFLATTIGKGTRVTDLSSDTGNQAESSATTPGTRTGSRLSPGTAVVLSYDIPRRYRGGHPRSYLPFGASADVSTGGEWSGAFTTAVETQWVQFVTAVLANAHVALDHAVSVSYYKGTDSFIDPRTGRAVNKPIVRTTPQVNNITGFVAKAKIGSQRRRNRKS